MTYVISQTILPSLDHESDFMTAMMSADAAMESIKFDDMAKQGGEFSVNQLEAVITNLDASIYSWQHDLSKSMSDAVKKLFAANDDKVKMLKSDLKKFEKEEVKLRKSQKEKGLTQEVMDSLSTQYNEVIDAMEHTKNLLTQYRTALYLKADVGEAIQKAMGKAIEYGNIIINGFKKYMDMVKNREDASKKRISFDDEKFESDLNHMIDALNKFGQVDDMLQQIQKEFDLICSTQIYGKEVSSNPCDGVKFEFAKTVTMNEQYDLYAKMANAIHKRLKELSDELNKTKKEKPGCLSYRVIGMETMLLLMISKKLSLASTMYLTPVMSVLDSYQC